MGEYCVGDQRQAMYPDRPPVRSAPSISSSTSLPLTSAAIVFVPPISMASTVCRPVGTVGLGDGITKPRGHMLGAGDRRADDDGKGAGPAAARCCLFRRADAALSDDIGCQCSHRR